MEGKLEKAEQALKDALMKVEELEQKIDLLEKQREAATAANKKKIEELQKQLDQLEDDVARAQATAKTTREECDKEMALQDDRHAGKVTELRGLVADAEEKERQALGDLSIAKTEKVDLTKQITTLKTEYEQEREAAEEDKKLSDKAVREAETLVRKKVDKIALQDEHLNSGEALRKEMNKNINNLNEENATLRTKVRRLETSLQQVREEMEEVRAGQALQGA